MRHTRFFRLMAALFGVWFTFTLVQPNGMMGMTMNGSDTSMDMAAMTSMSESSMSETNASMASGVSMEMSADQMAAMHHVNATSEKSAEQSAPVQPSTPPECEQHDCCCSALSPISLMPEASLAWLPEHIVEQDTPRSGDCVVHTDGQLRLPFANGPPRTVTA